MLFCSGGFPRSDFRDPKADVIVWAVVAEFAYWLVGGFRRDGKFWSEEWALIVYSFS